MCLAIKYLHDRQKLIRNIRLSSFFMTKKGIVKLVDFGMPYNVKRINFEPDSISYTAPELINNAAYS